MAPRLYRKLGLLAKIETTEGTDAAPTGAANAIRASNASITPLAGEEVQLDRLLPYLGNQGVELVGTYAEIKFDVEIAGAGAAGTAPAYGPLLQACGMNEVVTAGTDVQYAPVSNSFESASLYYNADGVNHILLGARGSWTSNHTAKQVPHFTFTMKGLLGTIADTALPTVDLTAFIDPVPVSKANTTLTLHGWSAIAESLALDIGNQVTPEFLIGSEDVPLDDRKATGTAVVRSTSLATVNWFSIAKEHTRAALAFQHGTTAGNIVKFDAPKVQIGRPTQGQTNGKLNYSLPLMLTPDDGDDEIVITVK